jgi:hypothetical protein
MKPSEQNAWLKLGVDAWTLGLQATHVIGLRTARIASGGPAAALEAWLMLSEKWHAATEIQADLLTRGPDASPVATTRRALAVYKRKVAANDAACAKPLFVGDKILGSPPPESCCGLGETGPPL